MTLEQCRVGFRGTDPLSSQKSAYNFYSQYFNYFSSQPNCRCSYDKWGNKDFQRLQDLPWIRQLDPKVIWPKISFTSRNLRVGWGLKAKGEKALLGSHRLGLHLPGDGRFWGAVEGYNPEKICVTPQIPKMSRKGVKFSTESARIKIPNHGCWC